MAKKNTTTNPTTNPTTIKEETTMKKTTTTKTAPKPQATKAQDTITKVATGKGPKIRNQWLPDKGVDYKCPITIEGVATATEAKQVAERFMKLVDQESLKLDARCGKAYPEGKITKNPDGTFSTMIRIKKAGKGAIKETGIARLKGVNMAKKLIKVNGLG